MRWLPTCGTRLRRLAVRKRKSDRSEKPAEWKKLTEEKTDMWEKFRQKFIGDRNFYRMALTIAVPIMVQNGITNFVSLLDNIMVGSAGNRPDVRGIHRQSDHFRV